ncbi:exopolysaccharide biosynthesis protein [Pseudogemmobacter sonorensis]|uniref:exopolysaccharide biosynthesis protein n=1 Tax=Pseudogemmobacter sonorensis TaxID=2989681 RepID=UPI0036B9834C
MPGHEDALSDLLDRLEAAGREEEVTVATLSEMIGARSFAGLMLVFALIAVSPASVVPGVTSAVAVVEFLLVGQMMLGRKYLWLPPFIARRGIEGARLAAAVEWLRRPVRWVSRFIGPRLSFLLGGPWIFLWLGMVMALTVVMPFMEVIPGAGTIAATCIALVAAAILTRDGLLILFAALFAGAFLFLFGSVSGWILSLF